MHDEPFTNRHIGHRIRSARIGTQLAISELSDRTSIPIDQLEAFELDQDMITVVELIEVARAMQLPPEYFLSNQDQKLPVDQWRLINGFQKLNPMQQTSLLQLVDDIQNDSPIATETRTFRSPKTKRWPFPKLFWRSHN